MAMFWGLFQRNLGELPEKTIPPRLTLQREIWREKKNLFYYCECVYEGSTGEDSKKWKIHKRQGNTVFQKRLASFTVLKAHCHTQAFHFLSCFFFLLLSFFFPVTQTKCCVFICPFCALHCYTEHHV